jgi:hypothetical protein
VAPRDPAGLTVIDRAVIVVAITGVAARLLLLDRLPGINGDEAWYGANIQALLSGQPSFWFTPSGNPLNPLHSGPLAVLLLMFPPTLTLLRLPEVLWSILAVAIAFPLLRGSIGRGPALITTMLLAASPVAIAYGRLGWDPSGSIFITLVAVGLAMQDRPLAAAAAGLVTLAVHPTNVFVAPILVAAWMPHGLRRYTAATASQRRWAAIVAGIVALLGVVVLAALLRAAANNPNTPLPSIAVATGRTFSLAAWGQLVMGIARLYSGSSTLTYIAGPPAYASALLAQVIGITALVGLAVRRGPSNVPVHGWLLAGMAASVVLFMIAAGPGALEPGYERYALFLLVPLIIVVALGLVTLFERRATLVALVVSTGLLIVTTSGYFAPLLTTGGAAHIAFRTGPVEPKQAAADFIRAQAATGVLVVCHDWWSYWPLRYLLHGDDRIIVSIAADANLPPGVSDRLPTAPTAHGAATYEVVLEGGDGSAGVARRVPVFTATDAAGRPVVHVFRVN